MGTEKVSESSCFEQDGRNCGFAEHKQIPRATPVGRFFTGDTALSSGEHSSGF